MQRDVGTALPAGVAGEVGAALRAAPHPGAPHLALDEHALVAGVEARLAEEVRRLVRALQEFACRAQAIGKDLPLPAEACKLVPDALALMSFQLAYAIERGVEGGVLLEQFPEQLADLELRLRDAFRNVDLDGRRFLAIALRDEQANEVTSAAERGEGG